MRDAGLHHAHFEQFSHVKTAHLKVFGSRRAPTEAGMADGSVATRVGDELFGRDFNRYSEDVRPRGALQA